MLQFVVCFQNVLKKFRKFAILSKTHDLSLPVIRHDAKFLFCCVLFYAAAPIGAMLPFYCGILIVIFRVASGD